MSTKLTRAVARKIDKTTKGGVAAPKKLPLKKAGAKKIPPPPDKLLAADLLAQLRAEIMQWHVGAEQSAVEARIAIGGKLVEAKEHAGHGGFGPWVEAHLPFEIRTAERAIKLYWFAISHQAELPKLLPLGVSKAYAMTSVFSPLRKALLGKPLHEIESPHAKAPIHKPLAHMTYLQLRHVIRRAEGKGKPPPSPAEALTREARQATTRLKQAVGELLDHAGSKDVDIAKVKRIQSDLLKMAKQIGAAFALDTS
jgi:hypothetical protein